jgi:hypothetical protein
MRHFERQRLDLNGVVSGDGDIAMQKSQPGTSFAPDSLAKLAALFEEVWGNESLDCRECRGAVPLAFSPAYFSVGALVLERHSN